MAVMTILRDTLLLGLVIVTVSAAEHTEQDTMKFSYDSDGGYLVAITHSTCYMVKLTHDESDHVHTNQGLEDLQLKMTHNWIGTLTETRVYHVDAYLPGNIRQWCSRHDIYVLDRVGGAQPSPTSMLSTTH